MVVGDIINLAKKKEKHYFPSISMKVMGILTNLAIISPYYGKLGLLLFKPNCL